MSKQTRNRIFGTIAGQAIGDALGLGTEFLSKKEVAKHYPQGLTSYDQIRRDSHRARWQRGEWTDDTEQMLCIMDSLLENGKIDIIDIAYRLYNWASKGGCGIGESTKAVLSSKQFLEAPQEEAKRYWQSTGKRAAANGGLMRTSILGIWEFHDPNKVQKNAEEVCKITHYDPRCVGSCVAVCHAISAILRGEKDIDCLLKSIAKKVEQYDPRFKEYFRIVFTGSLQDLELDGGKTPGRKIGYTLKSMAAGLWTLRNAKSFSSGLLEVIHEGGDADTNGAVAGALLGAKFGFGDIPGDWFTGLVEAEGLLLRCKRLEPLLQG